MQMTTLRVKTITAVSQKRLEDGIKYNCTAVTSDNMSVHFMQLGSGGKVF